MHGAVFTVCMSTSSSYFLLKLSFIYSFKLLGLYNTAVLIPRRGGCSRKCNPNILKGSWRKGTWVLYRWISIRRLLWKRQCSLDIQTFKLQRGLLDKWQCTMVQLMWVNESVGKTGRKVSKSVCSPPQHIYTPPYFWPNQNTRDCIFVCCLGYITTSKTQNNSQVLEKGKWRISTPVLSIHENPFQELYIYICNITCECSDGTHG